jgi:lycopene cyclase domain-containing protein
VSERLSYLWHLGVWAVPVLALQLAVLAWTADRPAGALLRAAIVPVVTVTGWLAAADHIAIVAGIWHFGEGKILGLRIGSVPVEEVLFFLTTNTLVAGGTILLDGLAARGPAR